MLGILPTTIDINGKKYAIRTDFRDILRVVAAFSDTTLTDREHYYVLMTNIYKDWQSIPREYAVEAYEKAVEFMECSAKEDAPSPRVVNWEKDEQLIFPAINKVAGFEVRSAEYIHWWTFLGYFQGIDREDTWGYILTLRQKKAKHKKLEKHEKEFWLANRSICEIDPPKQMSETTGNALNDIFNDLLKGGAE